MEDIGFEMTLVVRRRQETPSRQGAAYYGDVRYVFKG